MRRKSPSGRAAFTDFILEPETVLPAPANESIRGRACGGGAVAQVAGISTEFNTHFLH